MKYSLVAILAIGWLARSYALDADSLWGDEMLSYSRATQPDLSVAYGMLLGGNHPPLYELGLLRQWLQLGQSEFFLRFPSLFFGMLAISLTYTLGRATLGRDAGEWGALLLALSPLHVFYSREARMYGLLTCLLTGALYCLYRAAYGSRAPNKYWGAFAVLGAACLYTHYYAGLTLLALAGLMAIRLVRDFDFVRFEQWALAHIGIGILFTPWLPTLWLQLQNAPIYWLLPLPPLKILELPLFFVARPEAIPGALWPAAGGLLVLAMGGGMVAARRAAPPTRNGYFYLLAGVGGTFLIALVISLYKPLIHLRYFNGIVPSACLLIAYGLRPRALAVGLLALSLYSTYTVTTSRWQEDWRAVAAYVETHEEPGDKILVIFPAVAKFWGLPLADYYYHGNAPLIYFDSFVRDEAGQLSTADDIARALEALGPHRQVWVVVSARERTAGRLGEVSLPGHRLILRRTFDERMAYAWGVVDLFYLEWERPDEYLEP
jgi:4-amino-4-deoxy-L-arabinose transferase-like glycosyltransferase